MQYYRLARTGQPDFNEKLELILPTVTDKLPASLRWTELTVYRLPPSAHPTLFAHVEYKVKLNETIEACHSMVWEAKNAEDLLACLQAHDASEWMILRPTRTAAETARNHPYNEAQRSILRRGWGKIRKQAEEALGPKDPMRRGRGRPTKASLGEVARSVPISTRVTEEIAAQLDQQRGELSRSDFVEMAIASYLDGLEVGAV